MRLVEKEVDYYLCEIHPAARDAYIHSLKLKFQLSNKWRETFELDKLSPASAIYDHESRRYLVFSHWSNFLPQCKTSGNKLLVHVYPYANEIEETA